MLYKSTFFYQFIILDFYNLTKIFGQNKEISNTNHKAFHFHYCCVYCCISLSDNRLHSASPLCRKFQKENIFNITAFWPKKKRGWKSLDNPYSSSLDYIKPHKETLDRCVHLLPQCKRFIKRGLNLCIVMLI